MKFKNLLFKVGAVLCSFAFVIAISSLDTMCLGAFHQPKVPECLAKH